MSVSITLLFYSNSPPVSSSLKYRLARRYGVTSPGTFPSMSRQAVPAPHPRVAIRARECIEKFVAIVFSARKPLNPSGGFRVLFHRTVTKSAERVRTWVRVGPMNATRYPRLFYPPFLLCLANPLVGLIPVKLRSTHVLFAHDSNTFNSAIPALVHTDRNGFSAFSPMTTVDTALLSVSDLDKARYEFVWVFHAKRGTFDPARFSSRRRPLFTTDAKGSHAAGRAVEDACQFIEEQGSPDRSSTHAIEVKGFGRDLRAAARHLDCRWSGWNIFGVELPVE